MFRVRAFKEFEMRFWVMCGLLASLVFVLPASMHSASAATAAISGTVKGTDTKTPVTIYLQSGDENPTRYYDGYQTQTDKDGKFSFAEIAPGTYRLRAETMGFMNAGPDGDKGIEITLRPHDKRKKIVIPMVRRLALCGRVTRNGEGKQWSMSVLRYDPEFGTLSETYPPVTQPDGSYWFSDLEAGTYYLAGGGNIWYPGSVCFSRAKSIVVGPITEPQTCPFDIQLPQYQSERGTKISGHIAASNDDGDMKYLVSFRERNADGSTIRAIMMGLADRYKAGDSFSAVSECRGDYEVVLTDRQSTGIGPRDHKVIFDSKTVSAASEISDVVLTPHPMASINGEVHFEGISRQASCPLGGGQHIEILREGDGQFQAANLDRNNRFEFQNVAPGDYQIYLGPFLREAVYLKSITVDGKAAEGRRISIQQAAPVRMDVTLSADLANAAEHAPADLRQEHRWEVPWTRPKGSVSGTVLGDMVGGYTVKLRSARYNSNASGEYAVHTMADGTFRFDAVDPGVYTLRAESDGSVTYEYGAQEAGRQGSPITVSRGARVQNLKLSPPALGAICGRVTDMNGAPLTGQRIFVETFQYGQLIDKYNNMFLQERDKADQLTTDSDGRFQAGKLPPGEYFLAFPWGDHTVFFSSDGSLNAETPIRLGMGESAGCQGEKPLELHVPANVSAEYSISGEVEGDLPQSTGDRFWVTLSWDVPGARSQVRAAKLDEAHNFKIDRVPDGKFLLELHGAHGPEPNTWSGPCGPRSTLLASQTVEVHDAHVLDVKITPKPLPTMSGVVRFEHIPETWKNFDTSNQYINLVPRNWCEGFGAKLSADGSFTIDPVDVGDYEVQMGLLRDPFSIRSIRLNGNEVTGRRFHLPGNQAAWLEVIVSGDSGEVAATVSPDPSLPMAEPPVFETCNSSTWPKYQLILFPDPLLTPEVLEEPRLFYGAPRGDFYHPILQASALPPGHYRAVAAEHLFPEPDFGREAAQDDNRDFWNAVAQLGEPIVVQPAAKIELALPDKTVDVERLAAKWGMALENGVFPSH
jgi:hypothetical protein